MDSDCESLWKKTTGKPSTGKPYAGFDERELEIEHDGWASEALLDERGSNRYALPKPLRQLSTLQLWRYDLDKTSSNLYIISDYLTWIIHKS